LNGLEDYLAAILATDRDRLDDVPGDVATIRHATAENVPDVTPELRDELLDERPAIAHALVVPFFDLAPFPRVRRD
jgi:hypothetical protein